MNPPLKRNVRWQDLVPGNEYILNKGFIIRNNNNIPESIEQKPHIFKGYSKDGTNIDLDFEGDGMNISIGSLNIKDKLTFTQINEKNLTANKIRHFMTSRKVYKNAYKPPSGFYYKSALSRWENTTRKNNK